MHPLQELSQRYLINQQHREEVNSKNIIKYRDSITSEEKRDKTLILREQLIKELRDLGMEKTATGNKFYIGNLSPGCVHCMAGRWECLYITNKCTRTCVFCPMLHSKEDTRAPNINIVGFFNTTQELVRYYKGFNIRGCGISGGDPLTVLDRTLDFIKQMRQNLDKKFYIWIYTNSDMLDDKTAQALKEAGLDEIRFNLAANGYDISKIKIARKYFETLSVEIPAIPEDQDKVKKMMVKIDKLGVRYLNLHELMFSPKSVDRMTQKGYKMMTGSIKNEILPQAPAYNSETTILELMRFSIEHDLSLNVNHCTQAYKIQNQRWMMQKNRSNGIKKPIDTISNKGYLKKLIIIEDKQTLDRIYEDLISKKVNKNMSSIVEYNEQYHRMELHTCLLDHIKDYDLEIGTLYQRPCTKCGKGHDSHITIMKNPVAMNNQLTP